MNLIHMHHTNPVSWVFMPQFIQRIRAFSDKHNLDINADLVEEMARCHFVVKTPQVFMLASVDGSKMVGHLIATIDVLNDFLGQPVKRYLTILQAEHDPDHPMNDEFRGAALGACVDWARDNHCDALQLLCEGEWRIKLFRDRYGFKVHKTIMQMEV